MSHLLIRRPVFKWVFLYTLLQQLLLLFYLCTDDSKSTDRDGQTICRGRATNFRKSFNTGLIFNKTPNRITDRTSFTNLQTDYLLSYVLKKGYLCEVKDIR